MKFSRHTEGMKGARLVFKRAREDSRSKHHVSFGTGAKCHVNVGWALPCGHCLVGMSLAAVLFVSVENGSSIPRI